jgi:DNA-binding transcriptional MerR regulator
MAALLTIGQLARRSGVPARTIRFWSDTGVLPEIDRSPSGYRRYDAAAVARLDLVRTLRELGMGLEDVREVLLRRRTVDEVATAHVRDRRPHPLAPGAARRLHAARPGRAHREGDRPDERPARLSAAERQRMIDDFVADAFAGTDPDAPGAGIATAMRSMPTELPEDPTTEQVEAWVELAELVSDPAFRARVRQMAVAGASGQQPPAFDAAPVQEHASTAVATGIDPAAPEAADILARIGVRDLDEGARRELADTIDTFTDRRVERYWTLLGTLNGWPAHPSSVPAFAWFAAALRAR